MQQYDHRRYSTLGPSPIRTPPTSEDGSSVVSAVPPYRIAPPNAIQHVVVPDDKKQQQQQQPPLSPTSPYGSHPSSPNPSFRPPLPSAPATYRLSPAVEAPSAPSSPHMSDVESMMDTFPPYDVKSHHQVQSPPAPVDSPQPQTHFSSSVSAGAEGGVPQYQSGEDSRFADLRLKEVRKQRAEEGAEEERRSVEHWREEQERDRARELAQIRTSKPPSIDSGASMSSTGTRRPPSDSSSSTRRRPSVGMTAAESAAQHHFRLAQQHLEAAQRLAADSSLSLRIDRPQATRAASFENRQASPFEARGGRPFDPFDDGQSTYEYADSVVDPEADLNSPESSFYEDASEFGESRYGSYSSQPRVPPRRSMSLSSVSTSAPSYRSAPPLPPVPSLSSSAGGAYQHTRYDNYRSPAPHQRQLPAYPPRQPSNLAPHPSTRPSRSDSLQSTSDASLGSSYTFGGRQPSPSAPIEEGYVEVLQAGGWEGREGTARAPSPPRRAASIRRSPSIRRGSSPPPPLPTSLPHPSTFTQEPTSFSSQPPPSDQQSQYWPSQQPQHRTYSPSEMSVSTQLPMYQPPAPSPSAQHRPTPPPQHQAHYAPSPYPQAAPHMYGQPTSYILSPTGHPIPVYAAISAAPPPAPRQALAVHSQPLMYDHRLPYSATPSSAPPSAPPAQPQQLYAAAPTRTGSSPTGILKKSPSNSNLLLSQPNITPPSSTSPSQQHQHPYAQPPPTRPSSTWSASSSEGRGSPSILGGGSNPYPAKLRSRMASLREKLTSSPHVRFQSPVPGVVEAEQAKEKEREREMGVQRRDDAVAAMNKSFGMLL